MNSDQTERDLEMLSGLAGVHFGLLDEQEQAAFLRLEKLGLARRAYSGVAGLLGLSTISFINRGTPVAA